MVDSREVEYEIVKAYPQKTVLIEFCDKSRDDISPKNRTKTLAVNKKSEDDRS